MPSIVGEALHTFGTAGQKERWLRPLLTGEKIAAEALTGPRGGSLDQPACQPRTWLGRRTGRGRSSTA